MPPTIEVDDTLFIIERKESYKKLTMIQSLSHPIVSDGLGVISYSTRL